jgi:hypothetical protein
MPDIKVKPEATDGPHWVFLVSVDGGQPHRVTVKREYWSKLTGEKAGPAKLVAASFEFLLEREGDGSILSAFDLAEISRYFPEFEAVIRGKL